MRSPVITAVAAAIATASALASPALAARPADPTVSARAALAADPATAKLAPGDRFDVVDVITDPDGEAHVRLDRIHRGVPVEGGDVVVHLDAKGRATGITAAQQSTITVDTDPAVTGAEAATKARDAVGGAAKAASAPKLVVTAGDERPALVWEVRVERRPGGPASDPATVTVDAEDGRVIDVADDMHEATGTGRSMYSGTVPMQTTPVAGGFAATDPLARMTVCTWSGSAPVCPLVDADNQWTGPGGGATAAADASYGGAQTAELFRSVFNRPTLLKDGSPITIYFASGWAGYSNAFYDSDLRWVKLFQGTLAGAKLPAELDIVGHELGHAVTMDTARLDPNGSESGGLNEATSDIFGTMVEFRANNPADPPDYVIGEHADIRLDGQPLRWMVEPSKDGPDWQGRRSPNCYSSAVSSMEVHFAAGLANKFFYMLAEGSNGAYGKAPTCEKPAVTGIGQIDAGRIWYKALTAYFTSTTRYQAPGSNDARAGTLAAAADLFGVCSTQYRAVQAAWTATLVEGEDLPCSGVFDNPTDVGIFDLKTSTSTITAALQGGKAPKATQVLVDIKHPRRGDLQIDLVAPDGTKRRVKSASTTDTGQNLFALYTVDASSSPAAGTWRLEVRDTRTGYNGYIDRWAISL